MKPLIPYGYGLSYTTFEITDPKAETDGTNLKVRAKVKNTGEPGPAMRSYRFMWDLNIPRWTAR